MSLGEAARAPARAVAVTLGDGVHGAVVAAGREVGGEELLDRDGLAQVRIEREAGDPKPPWPRVDRTSYQCRR